MSIHEKPRVTVVFTGGTISMRFDPVLGGPVPVLTGAEILAQTPGLSEFARVSGTEFARLAGPHMTPALMWQLSRDIAQLLESEDVDAYGNFGVTYLTQPLNAGNTVAYVANGLIFQSTTSSSDSRMWTARGQKLVFAMFVNDVPLPKGVATTREGKALGRLCEIIYQAAE